MTPLALIRGENAFLGVMFCPSPSVDQSLKSAM